MSEIKNALSKVETNAETKIKSAADVSGSVQSQLNWLQKIMFALIVVLFLGFAGMFAAVGQMMYESITGKQASYAELQQTVDQQNDKIEALTDRISDLTKVIEESQEAVQTAN